MKTLKVTPVKRIEDSLVQLKNAGYVREMRIIQLRHPVVLIMALAENCLKLFYFNIAAFKSLKHTTIPFNKGNLDYIEQLLTLQHSNPSYFGVRTDRNLLNVYSLKTKKVVLEIKHPVPSTGFFSFFKKKEPETPISLYSCFVGDQVITWAKNSTRVCFWELSKKSKSENELTLSATPSENYAVFHKRNILLLQIDQLKYLQLIDVAKRVLLKTIESPVQKMITAPSTEDNVYFITSTEMQGITMVTITPSFLNEKLELANCSSVYKYTGPCPRFSVLTGGKYVTLSDIRKTMLIDFSGESSKPHNLTRKDGFDARGFIKIKERNLLFAPAKDGSVWIWRS